MHTLFKMILFFAAVIFFTACQSEQSIEETPTESSMLLTVEEIPELLQRGERIQNGKEWDDVQNYYGTFKKKITEGDQEALLNMAQLYTLEARITGEHGHYYPGALKLLDFLLSSDVEDQDLKFRALTTKAGVQLSQHDFQDALDTGKEAVRINPYNAQIYGVLVDAYVELGEYGKAVEASDRMVNIRPDLRSYARISYLREIHGDIEGAIEAMKMAVQAGPPGHEETAWTQLELGNLYARYGQPKEAKSQYEQILMSRPDYPFAVAALGELALERGDYEEAERLLKEAASIIPEVGYYEQLAHVYNSTNRAAELESTLGEIKVMLQDDVDSGHNMNLEYATIYRDLYGEYDKALEYAMQEYDKRPNNIDTNRMLAVIYSRTGEMDKAKKHLKKALITDARFPELIELQEKINL